MKKKILDKKNIEIKNNVYKYRFTHRSSKVDYAPPASWNDSEI